MADSILSIGLQGVNSGVNRVREAAQDIASLTTTDTFTPVQNTTGQGGPNTGNGTGTPTQATPTDGDITGDLATSIVDLKIGEIQVKASAAVIRTADEMLGTIVDIKA